MYKRQDIGNSSTLCSIAETVGLDKALITRLLKSDTDRASISKRDQNSREKGVSGIPTFIVENSHVVPGAQSQALWVKVITELKELNVNPK